MEKTNDELLAIYQIASNELSSIKTNQWSLASNTLFVFVALSAIARILENPGIVSKLLLAGLSLLALAMSSFMLYKLNNSVNYRKKIKKKIIDKLSEDAREVLDQENRIGPASRFILQTALTIGAGLNIWIIFN